MEYASITDRRPLPTTAVEPGPSVRCTPSRAVKATPWRLDLATHTIGRPSMVRSCPRIRRRIPGSLSVADDERRPKFDAPGRCSASVAVAGGLSSAAGRRSSYETSRVATATTRATDFTSEVEHATTFALRTSRTTAKTVSLFRQRTDSVDEADDDIHADTVEPDERDAVATRRPPCTMATTTTSRCRRWESPDASATEGVCGRVHGIAVGGEQLSR